MPIHYPWNICLQYSFFVSKVVSFKMTATSYWNCILFCWFLCCTWLYNSD